MAGDVPQRSRTVAALSRTPSYIRMAPKRAVTSFENLVALANDQERLQQARKMVWRDRGDPVVHLDTLGDIGGHALRGAIRAGGLGFGIRAGVNLFLLLFRTLLKPKEFRTAFIRHAVFGLDSFRFAAMLGSFTALYKFILNALPLILPSSIPAPLSSHQDRIPSEAPTPMIELEAGERTAVFETRSSHLSLNAQFLRKQGRRWHAALAGFIAGGIAVSFESQTRRLLIAQQLFVRGLQGSWNGVSKKMGIKIPGGELLLFALINGQILYAWLMRPDTIPRAYSNWILQASQVRGPAISMNRNLVREGYYDLEEMRSLIDWKKTTPQNKTLMLQRLAQTKSVNDFGARYGTCYTVHPWLDNCRDVPLDRFIRVCLWMAPVYGALHFIPMLLFKRKAVFKEPLKMLLRATLGTGRSAAFLGVYVVIYQTYFCWKHNMYEWLTGLPVDVPKWFTDMFISKQSFWLGGFLSGFSLLVEEKRRRGELVMYTLPKGLESYYRVARGKGLVPGSHLTQRSGVGESILCAVAMAMVMSTYQMDPQHLSGLVRRILYQFVGPN